MEDQFDETELMDPEVDNHTTAHTAALESGNDVAMEQEPTETENVTQTIPIVSGELIEKAIDPTSISVQIFWGPCLGRAVVAIVII